MAAIFQEFVPYYIYHHVNEIEYIGYSEYFKEIKLKEGEQAPQYMFELAEVTKSDTNPNVREYIIIRCFKR